MHLSNGEKMRVSIILSSNKHIQIYHVKMNCFPSVDKNIANVRKFEIPQPNYCNDLHSSIIQG